ncbi:hypothetical protein MGALJ_52320 [Mycobacterium gallinarum]|uniref:Uncharacterized protein n=1 Tax=Mycobacterium gallinarum TaxID=39689 RepID=A0A9W4B7P0_9MYCO|nr:hypothetical protein MGALJ_52320 [Mycobacterium gallinarum]
MAQCSHPWSQCVVTGVLRGQTEERYDSGYPETSTVREARCGQRTRLAVHYMCSVNDFDA